MHTYIIYIHVPGHSEKNPTPRSCNMRTSRSLCCPPYSLKSWTCGGPTGGKHPAFEFFVGCGETPCWLEITLVLMRQKFGKGRKRHGVCASILFEYTCLMSECTSFLRVDGYWQDYDEDLWQNEPGDM